MNIACRYCNAENPADARFCKLCGQPLAAEATRLAEPEQIEETVQDGYRLLADGRPHEALYVAKAALAQAPDNLSGLALKGMALEALDDLAGAVACFERVVELNPSSTLDRIKLEQLHRRLYETPYQEEGGGANWTAILAGVGATLVVIAVGALLALTQGRPKEPIASAEPEPNIATFQPMQQQPQQGQQPQAPQGANNNQPATSGSSIRPPTFGGGGTGVSGFTGPIILSPDQVSGLPDVHGQSGGTNTGGGQSGGVASAPSNPPPSNSGDDNVISPPTRDPVIQIKPHEGGGGGTGSGGSERESENIYRIANEKMKAGDYRGAIADFQKSLSGSTRPALTHQLIARCYRALGDFDNAKRHFEQALRLYEASSAPGAQAGAEACRRELAALGG